MRNGPSPRAVPWSRWCQIIRSSIVHVLEYPATDMRWVSPVAVLVTAACGVPPNGLKMASAFWDFLGSTSARTDRIMRLLDSELGEQPIPIAYGGGLQYFRRTDGLFSQPVEVAPCTGSQAESGWRCSTAHGVVKPLLEPVPASRAIDVLHADERALLTRFDDHYRHQRPVSQIAI
eukprot:SAG31_NODE_4432_length_3235_cov_3.104592_4_plen_176_part_00